MNNIAILLTCFNRKETTLNCLDKVYSFNLPIDIYLVDDNSSDGTSEAIGLKFPQVNLLKGSGDLFWNRGMHLAWKTASLSKDYDFYIWLNDDVKLYSNCFSELFECSKLHNHKAIISGVIENEDKSKILYGGSDLNKIKCNPNGHMLPIQYLNGNVVLIPKYVYNKLGNLDPLYHHDLGDVDYGLKALKTNIKVLSSRIPVGSGNADSFCRVRKFGTNIKERFRKLYSPLGSNPRTNFYFRNKNFGFINAISYYLFLHIINILPDLLITFLFNNKYK